MCVSAGASFRSVATNTKHEQWPFSLQRVSYWIGYWIDLLKNDATRSREKVEVKVLLGVLAGRSRHILSNMILLYVALT